MSIRPGVHIGGFAVLGPLGRGGMGEVYRGRDSRLKREVALKVLPDAFAADAERVARFQREAEILATLSHPHIAAIYGLEEAGGVRALVMELVDGPTLADRIARGPLPVDETLSIASQIVEALDYAHERGVLHRDLKPANIKVTPGGEVKLLDFGLAKALTPQTPGAEAAPTDGSPTITSPAFTHAGTILGTAAYMAPEQVRGKAVDRRADIWAFGCVLYEMLTGTRAFQGETTSDTLAAVLKSHPDWTKLPRSLPASPRRLVEHCLERDQKGRLRDIADARLLLEDTGDVSTSMPAPARIVPWARVALGAFVAAALVAAGWFAARGEPPAAPGDVRRLTVQLPVPLSTSTTGGGASLAIADDGTAIAFTGRGAAGANQIYLHRLTDGTTRRLRSPGSGSLAPGTGETFPAFSADGRLILFSSSGALWQTDADGREPDRLCSAQGGGNLRGNAWSEAGRGLAATNIGLLRSAQPGGECEMVLPLEAARGEARFLSPRVLPGGRGMLLSVSGVSDDADSASVVVIPAGTAERRVIVRGARSGRLTTSGHLLFARGHQIFAAPFDLESLTMTADPVVVLSGVASGQFSVPLMDVSARGDLVYAAGRDDANRLVWVTRTGVRSDAGATPRAYLPEPQLSPDGRRVLVPIGTGDHFLWLWTMDTGTLTPLTDRDTHQPIWSPDGTKVAFPIYGRGIAIRPLESSADTEMVVETASNVVPLAWSPDGATMLFSRRTVGGSMEIAALSLRDRQVRALLPATEFKAQFSPDGRWFAYVSTESGRREVFVTDFPAAKIRRPVSTDGGFAPTWSADGRELFYVNEASMMAAAVRPGASIEFGRPVRLFDGIDFATAAAPYSVAPDGRFLFVEELPSDATDRSQLTLVLNWFEELNRLVPTR